MSPKPRPQNGTQKVLQNGVHSGSQNCYRKGVAVTHDGGCFCFSQTAGTSVEARRF